MIHGEYKKTFPYQTTLNPKMVESKHYLSSSLQHEMQY
jgi:hypothetical protein